MFGVLTVCVAVTGVYTRRTSNSGPFKCATLQTYMLRSPAVRARARALSLLSLSLSLTCPTPLFHPCCVCVCVCVCYAAIRVYVELTCQLCTGIDIGIGNTNGARSLEGTLNLYVPKGSKRRAQVDVFSYISAMYFVVFLTRAVWSVTYICNDNWLQTKMNAWERMYVRVDARVAASIQTRTRVYARAHAHACAIERQTQRKGKTTRETKRARQKETGTISLFVQSLYLCLHVCRVPL